MNFSYRNLQANSSTSPTAIERLIFQFEIQNPRVPFCTRENLQWNAFYITSQTVRMNWVSFHWRHYFLFHIKLSYTPPTLPHRKAINFLLSCNMDGLMKFVEKMIACKHRDCSQLYKSLIHFFWYFIHNFRSLSLVILLIENTFFSNFTLWSG